VSRGADPTLEPGLRPAERAGGGRGSVVLTLFLILAALAVALATLAGPPGEREAARLDVRNVNGDVVISNSKEGMPIVSMPNLAPGDTATGDVTLENTGTARGYFYLAPQDLVSTPGPGGGDLADRLIVRVTLTKEGGTPKQRYGGPLSEMGTVVAGRFSPGESGTYEFETLTKSTGIPGRPTPSRPYRGDNKLQGSSVSVTFGWGTSP
jgi:hypothetical protein